MGYHVAIVRTEQGVQKPIGHEEVERALELHTCVKSRMDAGGRLLIRPEFDPPEEPLLIHQDGEVWTTNPSAATLRLMIDLSSSLSARVRGDSFESYRTADQTYVHPDDEVAYRQNQARGDRLRVVARFRPWLLRLRVVLIFMGLAAIYALCAR